MSEVIFLKAHLSNTRFSFSSIPDNKEFHGPSVGKDSPFLYCILSNKDEKPLSCPPSMRLVQTTRAGKTQKYLLRGDSEGFINMWAVPDVTLDEITALQTANATTKGMFRGYFESLSNKNFHFSSS